MSDRSQDTSRTPVNLVVATLDCCGRTFGVAPCAAKGEPCYNTFFTCKYKPAFLRQTKDYEFVTAGPLPWPGPRPYIKSVTPLPTEIAADQTVTGRLKVTLIDEPDSDIGIDPYVAQRASVQGTYFKKLLARNPNYKGRPVKYYEGFLGDSREEFVEKFRGTIAAVSSDRGLVTIEVADTLKALADIDIPPALDLKLVAPLAVDGVEMTLNGLAGLAASGYVRLGDEIIEFGSVDEPTNRLLELSRGAFATVPAEHALSDRVDAVRYFPPQNPFDLLLELLQEDCGLPAGDIDEPAFISARDWPGGEVPFSTVLVEKVAAAVLVFELADILDCKIWVGENLKLTIRRNLPNAPGRPYLDLSDDANIAIKTPPKTDLNDDSRSTRVILFWDKATLATDGEVSSYSRGDIGLDPDAESVNGYGEQLPKTIFCRWLRSDYLQEEIMDGFIQDFVLRRLLNIRDARPLVTISVELKDHAIRTGDFCLLQTDELTTPAGIPISDRYQVVKRDPKGHLISMQLQKLSQERICFIAPDDSPDYDQATAGQREYGFIAEDDGALADGPGYVIW